MSPTAAIYFRPDYTLEKLSEFLALPKIRFLCRIILAQIGDNACARRHCHCLVTILLSL
jgi:hypothetical protein